MLITRILFLWLINCSNIFDLAISPYLCLLRGIFKYGMLLWLKSQVYCQFMWINNYVQLLKIMFLFVHLCFFILKKHDIFYSAIECVFRTFGVVEEEEFRTYIFVRLLGSFDFLLGIHMILFTQFLHEHIWLLMPLFTILIVCWSKNNFVLYLTSCMDLKYLLLIYESQSWLENNYNENSIRKKNWSHPIFDNSFI